MGNVENEGGVAPVVRKGQDVPPPAKDVQLRRFLQLFDAPAFDDVRDEATAVAEAAHTSFTRYEKHARTTAAGEGFARPDVAVSTDWLRTRDAIRAAQARHDAPDAATRVLVVCGSPRNDQTCPGEMSKTWRLTAVVREVLDEAHVEHELLDLSRLCSEPSLKIHPCKSCVSTAMPLCHWPCSCYPNHALGQVQDWMNDIYPMWVAAHAIVIVTPVQWYGVPSALKAMIDRLVCADGGNADYTSTNGKDPAEAKALELRGWEYPKHLAGRAFGVVVHGDAAGAEGVKDGLVKWLEDMGLSSAGHASAIARYVGYYGPYATSHDALDADDAFREEVRNVARSVLERVRQLRAGVADAGSTLAEPRPK